MDDIFEGINELEAADPADGAGDMANSGVDAPDSDAGTAPGDDSPSADEGGAPPQREADDVGGAEQPVEERSRFAAQRRAREAEQARTDKIYEDMFKGQVSPHLGREIRTEADYRTHIAAQANEERRRAGAERDGRLRQAGVDPDLISQIVSERVAEHPAVKSAEQAAAFARKEAARAAFENGLREISAIDPAVKTADDLMKLPTAAEFDRLISGGMGVVEAFKVANFDAVGQRRAAAARQAALNSSSGKDHLRATGSRGDGGVGADVPADTLEMYRDLNPWMTDAEIRKHYAKHHSEERSPRV